MQIWYESEFADKKIYVYMCFHIILCLGHRYPLFVLLPALRFLLMESFPVYRRSATRLWFRLGRAASRPVDATESVSTAKGYARERVKPDRNNFEFG